MSRPVVSRRSFVIGGAAVAALAAAYPLVRQVATTYPEPPQPWAYLSAKPAAIYRVLGDFLIPPGGPLPGSAGDERTLGMLDALLGDVSSDMRWKLLSLPLVFEHGTLLDRYGARAMTALPPDRQREYLEDWASAGDTLRAQLFVGLRSVFGMTYFERSDVVAALGIAPGCG